MSEYDLYKKQYDELLLKQKGNYNQLEKENSDLRAKMETAERRNAIYQTRINDMNNFGLDLVKERDELLKKIEQLESQLAESQKDWKGYCDTVVADGTKRIKELESHVALRNGQLNHISKSSPFKACELARYFLAVTPSEVSAVLQEQERYAELGRLAVEASNVPADCENDRELCDIVYIEDYRGTDIYCQTCVWSNFCQKRAELMAGDHHD